jgi:hypothetical protein
MARWFAPALVLCTFAGVACAEPLYVAGSTSGYFTDEKGNYVAQQVNKLSFEGESEFESPDPLKLGVFELDPSYSLINYFPYQFRLSVYFDVPDGVNPYPGKIKGDVMGFTIWMLGGVYLDFDNSAKEFTYQTDAGTGTFALTVSDAFVLSGKTATVQGRITSHNPPGPPSVQVSESHPLLSLAAMGGGLLIFFRKLRGKRA